MFRAVEDRRMIEQRAVAVGRLRQLLHQMRQHLDVILVHLNTPSVACDPPVVGPGMEAERQPLSGRSDWWVTSA